MSAPRFCLTEVELFADLAPAEVAAVAERAPMRSVAAGTTVWSPSEPYEVLVIVKEGLVRIYRRTADGRTATLDLLGPGMVFGEMPLLGQRMAGSWAEAVEPSVLCLMSPSDVRRLLLADPRIAARICEAMGRRIAEVEQRLADAVLKGAPQRVAALLVRLAQPPSGVLAGALRGGSRAGGVPPEVRLTHEQVAELVGTTRETTTKVLGQLQADGLVRLRRGRVVVLAPDRLRALATVEQA